MTANRRLVLAALAVALVQIGFLSYIIAGRASILRSGQEILLEVRPVDPRDLLRGDYVRLGYNISSVPTSLLPPGSGEASSSEERDVYVRLKPDNDGIWQAVAARYDAAPETQPTDGEVDIKGKHSPGWGEDANLDVTYGIERFYLPEGEGKAIEADMRERSFRMRVAVASDGTAQIKAFYDGDEMLFEEPLY